MNSDSVTFRTAKRDDLPAVVQLLADDPLGVQPERLDDPLSPAYYQAFEAIEEDPHNDLLLAQHQGKIIGVLQVTLIPNLTYQGRWRAQIEGVRVSSDFRGKGVGGALMAQAIEKAHQAGCHLVQLTTDKRRPEAVCFHESLGFRATHEAMKLSLTKAEKP